MKPFRNLLFAFAATCLSALAADQALLKMLPGDAMFIAGINADQIRTSRFGQFLLDQLKSEEQNMEKFISMTGFDPRRDLKELIVASNDARGHGKAIVIARGRFDAARISQFARSSGAASTFYRGVEVLTGNDRSGGNSGWMAILDASTAIAGEQDAVKAAIERRSGNGGGMKAETLEKINELSTRYDAWMVSASLERLADEVRPEVGQTMQGNLMAAMQSVTGGVRFGANIEVMAEAVMRSDKDAQAMVDVVKFLAGMMQLNSEDKKAAEFAKLLDKMDLKASGNQFRMTMTLPEDVIETILSPASVRRKVGTPII
jgi:hypothetical protein